MTLWFLEVKRLLKTRFISVIMLGILCLSAWMAYLPVSYVQYAYQDAQGQSIIVTGREALQKIKETRGDQLITVTPEFLANALLQYQEALAQFGNDEGILFDMPDYEYSRLIAPIRNVVNRMREVYSDSKSGLAPNATALSVEDAQNFYVQCRLHLQELMMMEQENHPNARQTALRLYQQVEMPFLIYPGVTTNSVYYETLVIFLVAFGAVLIAATTFSADYQSGADDIQRCCQKGRYTLAFVRLSAVMIILALLFIISLAMHLIISNSLFGWEGTKMSLQILYSAVTFLPLNLGGEQLLTALAGLLSLLAVVASTLWISSQCKSNVSALAVALTVFLAPMIIYIMSNSVAFANWAQCLFPAGSLGLQNAFAYTLWGFQFLHLGNFSVFVPFAIIGIAIVEIPLFIGLTAHSYVKRQ